MTAMKSGSDPETLLQLAATMFGPLNQIKLPETGEMRLNIGSYAARFPPPAWLARRVFMATVAALAPQAMEDLHRRQQQLVDRHKDYLQDFGPLGPYRTWDELRACRREILRATDSDFERDSIDSMSAWMAAWHLGDAQHTYFVYIGVIDVLNQMYPASNDLRPMMFLGLQSERPDAKAMFLPGELSDLAEDWTVILPNWVPTLEHRSDYEVRARAEFERQLAAQLNSTCKLAEEAGLTPTATKRNGVLHFRWLVRYQVLGESMNSIAQSECVAYKTVCEAVKRTAEAIDLPLRRPSPAGRKPGQILAPHAANSG